MRMNLTFASHEEGNLTKQGLFKRIVKNAKEGVLSEKILEELQRSVENALITMVDQENG